MHSVPDVNGTSAFSEVVPRLRAFQKRSQCWERVGGDGKAFCRLSEQVRDEPPDQRGSDEAENAVLRAADVPTPVQNQFSETAAAVLDSTAVTLIACALPFPSGLTSNSTLAANQELPNRHQQENAHLLASLQQYSVADISRMAEDILPASAGCDEPVAFVCCGSGRVGEAPNQSDRIFSDSRDWELVS